MLAESREELARADNKSALLLAAAGVIVGALLAAFVAGDWTPAELLPCLEWLWWVGAAAGVGGLIALSIAVYPRTSYRHQRAPAIVAYFGDVVSTPPEQLADRIQSTAAAGAARSLDQLRIVAHIVDKKYRGIQFGLWLFGISGLLCTASVLFSYLLA